MALLQMARPRLLFIPGSGETFLRRSVGAADAEVDDLVERAGGGPRRHVGQRGAGARAELARAIQRRLDSTMPLHQANGVLEVAGLNLGLAQRTPPERAFLLAAAAEAHDHGQRDLAFAEVVAGGLAESGAVAGVVERIVDELEGDAEVVAVALQRRPLARGALGDGRTDPGRRREQGGG